MTKGIGTQENRELAFEVFKLFGGRGMDRMLGRLKWEHDIDISERTLYEWKTEGGWDERLEAQAHGEAKVLTVKEKMLASTLALIEKHERQFTKEGAMADAQATYAYTSLVKTAMQLAAGMSRWETTRPPFAAAAVVADSRHAELVSRLGESPEETASQGTGDSETSSE